MDRKQSTQMLGELKAFARFSAADQRYIRRSLDIGLRRGNAVGHWARNATEMSRIEQQTRRYRMIELIRSCIPDDDNAEAAECFLAPLITLSAGDLADDKISDFEAYRFLYERLIGPAVRPWLVSAFCAAAALPGIHPDMRKQLLQSIPVHDAAAPGWSIRAPLFFPEWVDKVQQAVS
ncbi:hypothetical protein [Sphingomonas xanthus]|uniref:Uncharacterized protein n=1 Tax=Sphingomonas xanthus TaxID=2594473 RepID=A0A516IU52_9SPHN|nr:hypothetical protein [Sphingomonas xanthus]QDP20374.1 hypothetical protein FMM02_10675 [Sphingomonas xanthus]